MYKDENCLPDWAYMIISIIMVLAFTWYALNV